MLHSTAHWQRTVHGYGGIRRTSTSTIFSDMAQFPDEVSLTALTSGRRQLRGRSTPTTTRRASGRVEAKLADFTNWLTLEKVIDAGRVYSLRRPPPGGTAARAIPGVRERTRRPAMPRRSPAYYGRRTNGPAERPHLQRRRGDCGVDHRESRGAALLTLEPRSFNTDTGTRSRPLRARQRAVRAARRVHAGVEARLRAMDAGRGLLSASRGIGAECMRLTPLSVGIAADVHAHGVAGAAGRTSRSKSQSWEVLTTTLFFAVSCVLVFAFAFVEGRAAVEDAAAGILWIAIAFSGTLALGRTFERERLRRDAARAAAARRRRGRRSTSASCSACWRCSSSPSCCSCRWSRCCSRRRCSAARCCSWRCCGRHARLRRRRDAVRGDARPCAIARRPAADPVVSDHDSGDHCRRVAAPRRCSQSPPDRADGDHVDRASSPRSTSCS